jgi:hypothetical protein
MWQNGGQILIKKEISTLLMSILLLGSVSIPALGISVSSSTGDGQGSVGVSGDYSLDDSTSLSEQMTIGSGSIAKDSAVSGSGNNSISQDASGSGYLVQSQIGGSGDLVAQASVAASGQGAGVSQDVAGNGIAGAAVAASSGSSSADQVAGVSDGSMSTSQSVVAGYGVAASQKTSLSGDSGVIGSNSASDQNIMAVNGAFSGSNSMDAELVSASADRAVAAGSAKVAGIETLGESLGNVGSGDTMMSVDGLYAKPNSNDLGEFGVVASNQERSGVDAQLPSTTQLPQYTADGGRSSAYQLLNYKWTQANPAIKLWVKNDANLKNEGLDPLKVRAAVAAAGNTWDGAVHRNLFADGPTGVELSTAVNADRYDGKNVFAFIPFSSGMSGALAYTRTYYGTPTVGGKYSAKESDLCFNTGYTWWANTANPPSYWNIDVQSVATHELGHTLGLADLYGKSQFTSDTRQMMHYYTGVKRTLGNGDKNGIYQIYG